MQTQNESMTLAFPNWIGAKAEVSINRPGDQADVVIELFKGDRKIADVLIPTNTSAILRSPLRNSIPKSA